MLDQERDADLLLAAAAKSRAHAVVVSRMLTAAQAGFSLLAVKILEHYYPDRNLENELLHSELLDSSIYKPVGLVDLEGPDLIGILERNLLVSEAMLRSNAVNQKLQPLLEAYKERLREKIERDLLSTAAEEAKAFRSGT